MLGKISILFLVFLLLSLSSSTFGYSQNNNETFVILVDGYTETGEGFWNYGINIYQNLVNEGYIVGILSFYGSFNLNFSNGLKISDDNGTWNYNTPIENISTELYYSLIDLYNIYGDVNLDFIGHSMGGLIISYMLENFVIPLNVENVIFIATPFNGSNLADIASYLNSLGIYNPGYQADEMEPGSIFLNNLNEYEYNITSKYPNAVLVGYAGNYDPWWGNIIFNGENDGVVSVNSAFHFILGYEYTFPDLHYPGLDGYTDSGISYFEDQNVLNTIINNLSGNY